MNQLQQQHFFFFFFFQLFFWLVFQSQIVFSWQNLIYLDLSSNLLEGPLPSSLCNSKNMQILVLAHNKLNGTIPKCLGNFSNDLTSLDLRNNSFHGTVPSYFSNDIKLKNLGLNSNKLEGPLPQSIKNCKFLEVLDVGNNNIRDTFPIWLHSLQELHVLILRSNDFYGTIGISTSSRFKKLRIVDLANNNFIGPIPSQFLENLPAMMSIDGEQNERKYMGEGDGSYYLDSVSLVLKGVEMVIERVLSILITIDLSGNGFGDEIPESVGKLYALKLLNLSHNNFSGFIPPAMGRLVNLESLDLSWNQFKGKIPSELTKITSLSKFNVSRNQLSGQIPNGPQFDNFSNDSYYGNLGLCGIPLDKCRRNESGNLPTELKIIRETDVLGIGDGFSWKPVVLGYGFGTIVGLGIGGLMFYVGKPRWLLIIAEEIQKQLGIGTNQRRYIMVKQL